MPQISKSMSKEMRIQSWGMLESFNWASHHGLTKNKPKTNTIKHRVLKRNHWSKFACVISSNDTETFTLLNSYDMFLRKCLHWTIYFWGLVETTLRRPKLSSPSTETENALTSRLWTSDRWWQQGGEETDTLWHKIQLRVQLCTALWSILLQHARHGSIILAVHYLQIRYRY